VTDEALRFPVEGMTCSSCVGRISRALRKLDGIQGVRVDLGRELVTVRREPGSAPDAAIAEAIETAGYHARIDEAIPVDLKPTFLERILGR
jgi:copper chaperone CopZ